jgi:ribosomal protein L29
MHTRDLRELSLEALTSRLAAALAEQAALREAIRFGKEKNHAAFKALRVDIARIQTIIREQQL